MKLKILDASPDGMTVEYTTFLMTYKELQKFIQIVSYIESDTFDLVPCKEEQL